MTRLDSGASNSKQASQAKQCQHLVKMQVSFLEVGARQGRSVYFPH